MGDYDESLPFPDRSYVSMRNFNTIDELHEYLKNMPEVEYKERQKVIESFLKSDLMRKFTSPFFVNQILDNISVINE